MSITFIPTRNGFEDALRNQSMFTDAQREMAIGSPHLIFYVVRRRSIPRSTRLRIFERDGGCCVHCGVSIDVNAFHVDHFIALANGGGDQDENLVAACPPCNLSKGAKWA